MSDDPIDGSVDNGDDCDDTNENTFPGAAPNDDPEACMQDEDDDDWGDDAPPPGVDAGSDCVDDNVNVFPGAAPNEDPPDLCAEDEDGDGWGDTMPPPGADAGTDCADDNVNIFPGAAELETPPDLCAEDEDDDGWGDTNPPPGVDAGTDCADDNENIFPGAAENEIPADLCAEDEDDDGWGDTMPPPGVDPGTDCADGNDQIFPGAAELEDPPDLCAEDEDDDGWGDDNPPPGVDPGSDCDDTNEDTFPGAAPNETPADLCTTDEDGDDWGDANPGGGASGSDCYDTNPDLNPGTLQLTAFLPYQGNPFEARTIETVDTATAALSTFVTIEDAAGDIPDVNIITATLNEFGEIFVNDPTSVTIHTVDYAGTCAAGTGEITPLGMAYGAAGDLVCGLEFGPGGLLYGINLDDELQVFDPAIGDIVNTIPIDMGGVPVDIFSCGMAYDCTADRLLVANGIDHTIYAIDPNTGAATIIRDLGAFFGATWLPTGFEYDPVSRSGYLSTGPSLFQVDLENPTAPTFIGNFGDEVSNLQYLPICI